MLVGSGRWVYGLMGLAALGLGLSHALAGGRPPDSFVAFESAHVRPLAVSADGTTLFAVNTPDNRLEALTIGDSGLLSPAFSIAVGLEPVAVAVRDDREVWVVNHLSDSVSVVRLDSPGPRVVRTLLLGDEPRDIVFAGGASRRAFITAAHRGQNTPFSAELTTEGVARADVWVFDPEDLGATLGGEPVTIVRLFGDTPRALAVSPDGQTVYAAVFRSGSRTTTLPPASLPKAPPIASADGVVAPDSGLIVRHDGTSWRDERDNIWDARVGFGLPDLDVFAIDAAAAVPAELQSWSGVGTILFNMAVSPRTHRLYVSNTDARNEVRFSGFGEAGGTTVRGHLVDHRVSVIRGGGVVASDLNRHFALSSDVDVEQERALSLAQPMGMDFSADGRTLFLAAMGSNKVAFLPAGKIERGTYRPRARDHVEVTGGGPTGLVADAVRGLLFVATRYDNGVSSIDTRTRREVAHAVLPNPEPSTLREGRPFLYDATLTSGRGNGSCGSCHLFGDNDAIAWDLGDPDGAVRPVTNAYIDPSAEGLSFTWHPMKGPMATQSMRGLAGHGPMHWRGDRSGADRRRGESLEEAAFREFNDAFVQVQGRDEPLGEAEMQAFTRFAMQLSYPPNPIRSLDNTDDPTLAAGRLLYMGQSSNRELEVCVSCHPIQPRRGIFGTSGLMSSNGQPGERDFKIPHFRDQYQKVGMFSWSVRDGRRLGDQVRGFGYNHNGATSGSSALAELPLSDTELEQLRQFLFAFPSGLAPIVGQQVTLHATASAAGRTRLDLLMQRAAVLLPVPECDLVARARVDGVERGWLLSSDGDFVADRTGERTWTAAQLRKLADGGVPVTFTCVPPGSGRRVGLDRDQNGVLDGDEDGVFGD